MECGNPLQRRNRRSTRGAALVELTCAIFIITVGVFGALQMYTLALTGAKVANEYSIAGRVLINEIETLRGSPFESLAAGKSPFRSQTPEMDRLVRASGTVEIMEYPGVPDLKSVRVALRWVGEHGRVVEKQLNTLIAKKR